MLLVMLRQAAADRRGVALSRALLLVMMSQAAADCGGVLSWTAQLLQVARC